MKRLTMILAAVLAAVATMATAVVSTGGAQQPSPPTGTLQFVLRERDVAFRFIDNPPRQGERRPPSTGDSFVITGPIRDQSNKRAGRVQAVFVVTDPRREAAQVSATFILNGGQIVINGSEGKARADDFAITGGTGRYAGARGTLRVTESRRENRFLFTFLG